MSEQSPWSPGGELECSICLGLLTENPEEEEGEQEEPVAGPSSLAKRARLLPEVNSARCGHVFHKHCISPWLKKKECPLCRKKLSKCGLRKILLPLSEDGQCRKCKWRVVEVDGMNFQLEKEKCKTEKMEVTLKRKAKQVEELEEKVEEIQMAMETDAGKHQRELGEMALEFNEAKNKMKEDFGREREKIRESGVREVIIREEALRKVLILKRGEEEKSKIEKEQLLARMKIVKKQNKRLKRENEVLMQEREAEMEVEEGERGKIRDWEEIYKLCKMDRDKERGKAAYYEKWCKRLSGIEESSPWNITDLTEVMQRKLNGDNIDDKAPGLIQSSHHQTPSNMTCGKGMVDISKDLDLSESEDDKEEHLEGSDFTSGFVEDGPHLSEDDSDDEDSDENTSSTSSDADDNND